MIIAAKCAPEEKILSSICKAGLEAVELYFSEETLLKDASHTVQICKSFPLRYAAHAPNSISSINEFVKIAKKIQAEVIVFHNIYWEDEWPGIIEQFKDIPASICIENTYSILEPIKFMRRYKVKRCLDLEHLQITNAGIWEEGLHTIIGETSHVHLTGYRYGSSLWHTHIHHSPEHNSYILNLLMNLGYSGFIVSEAKKTLQTYSEFKKLNEFYQQWRNTGAFCNERKNDER